MSDFLKSFGESFSATVAGPQSGLYGTSSPLGRMLKDGTQDDFNKYLAARQSAVKGEYDAYKTKFDAFESQAKTLIDIIGDNAIDTGTHLTSQEAAARLMKGKTTAGVDKLIADFNEHRKEGTNIRELLGKTLERGTSDKEVFNLTPQEIARGALGGSFKYTPKPFDLKERRTGLARFLRDDLGLFSETFETEREALAKKQAEMITAGLPGYEKYTGDTNYREARGVISLDPAKMRTQAEITEEATRNLRLTNEETRLAAQQQSMRLARAADERAQTVFANQQTIYEQGQSEFERKQRKQATEDIINSQEQQDALAAAIRSGNLDEITKAQVALDQRREQVHFATNITQDYNSRLANDKTYGTAYSASIPAQSTNGKITQPALGQKGYNSIERKEVEQRAAFGATIRSLSRIKDQSILEALPPRIGAGVNMTEDEFNLARMYITAKRMGRENSDVNDSGDVKFSQGLDKFIESQMPNANVETIKAFKDQMYKVDNLSGGSFKRPAATGPGGGSPKPNTNSYPDVDVVGPGAGSPDVPPKKFDQLQTFNPKSVGEDMLLRYRRRIGLRERRLDALREKYRDIENSKNVDGRGDIIVSIATDIKQLEKDIEMLKAEKSKYEKTLSK